MFIRVLICLAIMLASSANIASAGKLGDLDRYVFVANRTSAEIAIIDSAVDEVVAHLTVDAIPDQFVLSEDLAKLVASHRQSKRLSIVDLQRLETEAVLDLGFDPQQLQLDPDSRQLAVGNSERGIVALVSLDRPGEIRRIAGLAEPGALMFGRGAENLFIASRSTGRISVVDMASARVVDEIELGGDDRENLEIKGVTDLSRTPGGGLGFALHGESGLMTIIDLSTRRPVETIRLPGPATRAFPTADSQYVLVPNERDRSVSMVSTWTYKETKRLPGTREMTGINTGILDSLAVVLGRHESVARLVSLEQGRQVAEISLPSHPETGISAEAGTKVYVALSGSHRVAVIDLIRQKLVKMIDGVGEQPWAVSMAGGLSYCH